MKLFEDKSVEFHKRLSKKERSDGGVFFTPKDIRDIVFEELGDFEPTNILEPTCGTGEFISDCRKVYKNSRIIGVEIDPRSAELARDGSKNEIIVHDFMTWDTDEKFDLIIGNPPYFTRPTGFKHDPSVVKCRSNICIEVLHKCITRHLADNGMLAMVLPVSILNSKFYTPTIDLITDTMDVVSARAIKKNNFMGTNVRVMVFIIRKRTPGFVSKYTFKTSLGKVIINPDGERLGSIVSGKKTIGSLNVNISFGVTLASVKEYFVDKSCSGSFPLICYNNIAKKGDLLFVSDKYSKKRFNGRAILIPRGYAHGDYSFNFIDYTNDYFIIENHVIAITGEDCVLDIIAKSFADHRTREFCRLLCSSGDISKDYVKEIPVFG
uniref:Type II methyltransferase M.CvrRI n=1 Tax=Paramecium bursaria Chlorella virus XZ-6E TaxID=36360 RepID=MTR1_PBCVX|nr:RecName: Full=Type II methyltransferase M.CvrRI; Short=M.CviRI; AltName: Full=Adenine-specific methyltransferase CviRI; AltName: Full=Modification methylase CviRI [Paramecium bursaria Chlorella virus CV-XZ6E]pir/S26851/ site-specific DNA-methyltransferase (adenine-specific) (EC 2.1.1.72) CviRI - Chlorella virus CV-XZ6E [Paramecium bursaria Chlorella virus CV-XZ6E]AAA42900.1 TGCA adenine methyltransferase [Chlorella virus]